MHWVDALGLPSPLRFKDPNKQIIIRKVPSSLHGLRLLALLSGRSCLSLRVGCRRSLGRGLGIGFSWRRSLVGGLGRRARVFLVSAGHCCLAE